MTEKEKKRRGLKPNMSFGREVADTNGSDTATLREQPAEVIPTASEQPAEEQPVAQPSAYDRLLEEWEERKKKDERADKRDRIRTAIAGIGDTVGALGNLYFTTKYASPIPQTEGMSDKMRERYEAAKAKRDRNRAELMNYALNIAGREEAAKQAEAARKDRKAYYDGVLANAQQKAEDKAKADAAAAKAKAEQDAEKKRIDDEVVKYETGLFSKYPSSVPFNRDAEMKLLTQQWENEEITDDEYKAKFKVLKTFNNGYKKPTQTKGPKKTNERPASPGQQQTTGSGKRTYPAAGSSTTTSGKKTYPN